MIKSFVFAEVQFIFENEDETLTSRLTKELSINLNSNIDTT